MSARLCVAEGLPLAMHAIFRASRQDTWLHDGEERLLASHSTGYQRHRLLLKTAAWHVKPETKTQHPWYSRPLSCMSGKLTAPTTSAVS